MIRFALSLMLLMAVNMVEAAAETRTLKFADFDDVGVASGLFVTIRQGNNYQVTATGAAKDLQRLQVRQSGKRLDFSMPPGVQSPSNRVNIDITMPALRKLTLSGGSDGTLTMNSGSQPFDAELSGGAQMRGQISAGNISLNLSGGSQVTLTGSGQRVTLDGSGGSQFELGQLTVSLLSASLSGGSEATVHKNAKLGPVDSSGGSQLQRGR